MNNDPIIRFKELLAKAEQLGIQPYNAAALATTGKDLQPTVRMLLLRMSMTVALSSTPTCKAARRAS